MARFYDTANSMELARVEQLLNQGGIEYTVQVSGEGSPMNEILVAAEDLVYADKLLTSAGGVFGSSCC